MSLKRNLLSVTQWKSSSTWYRSSLLSTQTTTSKLGELDSTDWPSARRFSEVPGPSENDLIRDFSPGGPYYEKPHTDYILYARKQYGDLYRFPGVMGKSDILMAFNIDDFQKIFRTEGVWPTRPGMESMMYYMKTHQTELHNKAEGLLISNGEAWASFRNAVTRILMQPRNVKTFFDPMQEVACEFIERIRAIRDPDTHEVPDNFLADIDRLTFESVALVALNKRLGLILFDQAAPKMKQILTSFQTSLKLMYDLEIQPSLRQSVSTPQLLEYVKCLDGIFETIIGFVDEALKRYEDENRTALDDSELSVLEKLIKIDKAIAIVMAMDLLMAGVVTSTSVMTGTLLQIAKNPEKQAKLREEVHRILPQKDSLFTAESMKSLPYLRACIREGIRMHPIGPGMIRYTGQDLVLRGYQVPKGTQVMMNSGLLQREEKYFPQPNEFIPERWIRGDALRNVITPFTYLPFGFEPRSCVGRRIVSLELEIAVAKLVRNFHIEFNYPIENAFKTYFVNTPVIPLKFKFTEVEN